MSAPSEPGRPISISLRSRDCQDYKAQLFFCFCPVMKIASDGFCVQQKAISKKNQAEG